jgi:hypothetical protein
MYDKALARADIVVQEPTNGKTFANAATQAATRNPVKRFGALPNNLGEVVGAP